MPLFYNSTLNEKKPEYIIWVQTSFLGDIILTTSALALAKRKFPEAKQVLITTHIGKSLLQDEPYLDQILVFEKKKKGAIASFRSLKKELDWIPKDQAIVLQAHRSFRSTLLCRYLGFFTITYRQSNWSFLAGVRVERVACLHEAARIGLLLEPLGISRQDILNARPVLRDASADESKCFPRIGIAPGSVWGTKRWPKEKFAELVAHLLNHSHDGEVLLLGSDAEREQTDYIANQVSSPRVKNLAGKTSLLELKQLISSLDLLVTNDSSPIHFASAFNIPTVAIFGATVPELGFTPLSEKRAIAQIELECRPCSDHGPQVCPLGHFRCMRDLSVEQVLNLCRSMQKEY